ncbi:MAG: alginate export family protein, partial [Gammaproteobacteria bacterium]|nr:alginate export family protein [Gammaproteobacteria bacterium]
PGLDRLINEDYEFEFKLEYTVNQNLYLFFGASLVDESETVKSIGIEEALSGLERKEMGLGYYFGDEIESELKLGRVEITSASEWWLWWDEDLDMIRLESNYNDFEVLLGVAEEQARESSDADFIDPEIDGLQRIFASLSWEFAPAHSLNFYYLDQDDDSKSFVIGEVEEFDKIDEEDADLTWAGISYLGEFDLDSVGEIEIELHVAEVRGDEKVYEFGDADPVSDMSEIIEIETSRVSGSARSFFVGWTPARLEDWSFIVGRAQGSGDDNPDDSRNESFRQTGLQGDAEIYGELYQPEISNIVVQALGVEWEINDAVEVALLAYDYEQEDKADEMRDVSIEADLSGLSRDLGSEIDLVVTIGAYEGMELILTAAEFEAGSAYGSNEGDTSSFFAVEFNYEF